MSDLPYEIILGFIGVCAAMAAGFGVLALRSSRWRRVGRRGLWVAVAAIFSAIGRWATTLPLSPGQSELVYGLHDILGLTVTVLFVSFMIALTDQFLDKAGRSRSSSAPRIIRDMLHGMIIAVACAGFVVITLQMPLIGFVTTTGAVVIVLGIALQSILKDPFAGLLLTFEKPFEIGQWIVLENQITGLVLELNWRTTRLRTKNGNEVVVPNGTIATSKLINLNRPVPHFNCWVRLTVERSAAPGRVRSLLMERWPRPAPES